MNDTLLVGANLIIALAAVATAVAAIRSNSYTRKAINDQQTNFDRQLNQYKLALFAETTLKFEAEFNAFHFKQIRHQAAKALLNKRDEADAEDVFDFFETLGLFVRLGGLDDGIAYSVFFHWINLYWKAGKHHIGARRQDAGAVWGDFERLYKNVCDIEKRTDSESEDLKMPDSRLRQQLQEEIDLCPES